MSSANIAQVYKRWPKATAILITQVLKVLTILSPKNEVLSLDRCFTRSYPSRRRAVSRLGSMYVYPAFTIKNQT